MFGDLGLDPGQDRTLKPKRAFCMTLGFEIGAYRCKSETFQYFWGLAPV